MTYANLHLHSTFSDAGFTPEQLVLIGKALGYKALALTDHETDGGCKRFITACQKEDIRCVTGAEFYGQLGKTRMHLTALDFDQDNPELRAFIKERCDVMGDWTRKCFESGLERGIIEGITWDDIVFYAGEGAWLCVDSVFLALNLKQAMPAQGDAFVRAELFKTPEAKATKPSYPHPERVIHAVRSAGGVVALAHPRPSQAAIIPQLVELGLNGIEINHPSIDDEDTRVAIEAAAQYKLYRCGGTDHTGPMSCNGGTLARPASNGISEEDFDILVERRLG